MAPNFYPRMSDKVYHPCIHLFSNFWTADQVTQATTQIKELILGSSSNPTNISGSKGVSQLAIQTEFIPTEFSAHSKVSDALALLDSRIDAILDAGLALHLLLPVHQLPQQGWEGIDWQALAAEWPGSTFVPYQPSVEEFTNGQQNPYDILAEKFHKPIIEHLVATGRAEKLAVIYLMNEFGYPSNVLNDSASNWNNDPNWKEVRAQALKNTAQRNLEKGRTVAQGKVPVGLKFARVVSPDTGWTPFESSQTDQLASILNEMGPAGDMLGYDVYFNSENNFDQADKERFSPFFPLFPSGFFEISESGRECSGNPCQFTSGSRTSSKDILEVTSFWNEARGFNLFAWNASGSDQGCFAIVNENNQPCSGSEKEIKGLWDLAIREAGVEDEKPKKSFEILILILIIAVLITLDLIRIFDIF